MDMVVKRKITALCSGTEPWTFSPFPVTVPSYPISRYFIRNFYKLKKKYHHHNMSLMVNNSTQRSAASNENPT
jgi:hypothetical protein